MTNRLHPRRFAGRALAWALVAAFLVGAPVRVARADRIDDLCAVVEKDKDEKARIAAAVALGRLGDARAVPCLIKALGDSSAVVRGVAASALGHIGDPRALPALEKTLRDPSEAVRARARDALAVIREKQARASGGGKAIDRTYVAPKERPLLKGAPAAPRMAVTVKSTSNKTSAGGKDLGKKLRDYLVAELEATPEVTLDAKLASSEKLSTFVIDGAIVTMSRKQSGKVVELRCEVQISISNSKGRIMSVVTGGATLSVPAATFQKADEKALWLQALENAVRGAHQNMVAYMSRSI